MAYNVRPIAERCSSTQYAAMAASRIENCTGTTPPEIALPQTQKPGGKARVVLGAFGDAFRDTAEQRERTQRHNQRRQIQPRDQHRIQQPREAAQQQGRAAAAAIGQPPSRHNTPNTTAESPMIEPTDRSMPPVIMIGVIASASSPNSTLKRTTSKKFAG